MAQAPHHSPPRSDQNRKVIRGKIENITDRLDRYPLLEVIWERLIRRLGDRLAAIYGVPVVVHLAGKEIVRFSAYLGSLSDVALLSVFEAQEWNHSGLVVIDAAVAGANLEFLLGADPDTPIEAEARPVTALDRTLTCRLTDAVLDELGQAFSSARGEIGQVSMVCTRTETAPQMAVIAEAQTPVFVARLELGMGGTGRRGQIDIAIPMPMLDPIRRYLTEAYRGERKANDLVWTRHITGALLSAPLPIDVQLDRLMLPVREVMAWKVGDVLPLSANADSVLELHVGRATNCGTILIGRLGAMRGNKAVKLLTDGTAELGAPIAQLAMQLGLPAGASAEVIKAETAADTQSLVSEVRGHEAAVPARQGDSQALTTSIKR